MRAARAVLAAAAAAATGLAIVPASAAPPSTVSTFGSGAYGQLGDGGTASSPTRVAVSGVRGVAVGIAAGCDHDLAVTSDGAVWAWGLNEDGQLGDGSTATHATPERVGGLPSDVAEVAAGCHHSVALTSAGQVWAWGEAGQGELGDGTTSLSGRLRPVHVTALDGAGVIRIAAGGEHSAAVTRDGAVFAWGDNRSGQLGLGDTTSRATPTMLASLVAPVTVVALGQDHSLLLAADGALLAAGANDHGQLGDGTTTGHTAPVTVAQGIRSAAAGDAFSVAVTTARTVLAWGRNDSGQLGSSSTVDRPSPAGVPGLDDVVAVAAGSRHALALTRSGGVLAWGDGGDGQLGQGTESAPVSSPSAVPGIHDGAAVAAGDGDSLVLEAPGRVSAEVAAADAGPSVVAVPNTAPAGSSAAPAALAALGFVAVLSVMAGRRRRNEGGV